MAFGARSLSRRRMVTVFSCTHIQLVMRRTFRSSSIWTDGVLISLHHVVVDAVFNERRSIGGTKEALVVGLIFGEQ